ncbi:MAG: DNA polymerase I [Bacteroidetes bacterium]|nr:DNA polymerase I [Bacteroidota bacterium]
MARDKKLFLLDAMALIFRSYYAFINNPRITSQGQNTSALYGFTVTLLDIINKEKPTHLAVCTDVSGHTFRHKVFPEYKAGRQETPEDIKAAIPMMYELLKAMNIPLLGMQDWEADDIVGTIAKKAARDNFDVYMMTPDKDFAQLVEDHIFHYKPARPPKPAEVLGVEETLKYWEIKRIDQVIDILGLMGDKVDNIPGIPGIGEKTAIKLLRQYDTVENLLDHAHELKGKQRENVENNKEQALLSKQLATINLECPIEYAPDSYVLENYLTEELRELFSKYEFRTLGRRLFGEEFQVQGKKVSPELSQMNLFDGDEAIADLPATSTLKTIKDVEHSYKMVSTEKEIAELVAILEKESEFAFDTETSSLDPLTCEIVGMSFSTQPGNGWYVPINEEQEGWQNTINAFKSVLQDPAKTIVGQNIKYDIQVMRQKGVFINAKLFDTMLAHYIIDPDGRHGMDLLAQTYLSYSPVSIETLIGKKGKNQGSMKDLVPEQISDYAAEDADITLQLKQKFAPELPERNGQKVFEEVECPLIYVLADMELEGINLDTDFLTNYSEELQKETATEMEKVFELAGQEFNLNSPKQLGEVLFENLRLDPKAKKTKTGQYKTDEPTLQKLSASHQIVQHILDYRQLTKLKSTYVDALPSMVNPKTSRIHSTFNQAVAATGRLSSDKPNLQNIPIRSQKGRQVRAAFIPRDNEHEILSADYSQVELRIVASISGDEAMIEAFNAGHDIHTATAARVYGIGLDEVTRDQRSSAKAVNFGIVYGQGAFGLADNLGIKRTDAKEIIDQYFEKYSGLKDYMNNIKQFAREHGYVETLTGRRRYLRDINSANFTVKGFAERNAVNSPIQGTAADLIKIAMINIHAEMKRRQLKSRMILQVHDELLFDVHKSEKDEMKELVTSLMSQAMTLKVPLLAEASYGKNWLEAH